MLLLLCVSFFSAVFAAVDLSSYPLSQELREGYMLHWGFDVDAQTIRFAVRVSTIGWVGLGLSPNGGMPNSDIVIGWVNDQGQTFLHVRTWEHKFSYVLDLRIMIRFVWYLKLPSN